MANSYQRATSDGTMIFIDVSIDYLDRSEISVYFDDVLTTAWSWSGSVENRILVSPAVPNGTVVEVRRITDASQLRHEFSKGAAFTAEMLDEDLKQALHMAQEASEANLVGDFFTAINMHGYRVYNVGTAVDDSDVLTLGQARADSTTAVAAADAAEADAAASAASAAAAAASAAGAAGAVSALQARLANSALAADGDAMIAVKRTDIASAVALTLHDWMQKDSVNVLQVGVVGDGVADDAPLLNILGALGIPLYIPYTASGYKIGSTVSFACNVYCEGTLNPLTAIGAAPQDYNRFAVVLPSAGYGIKRRYVGIRVAGSVPLRAANVCGIRNDCENSYSMGLHVFQLNYGIVARSYSQTYDKCNASQCNTNFSAYARSFTQEINALTILGGNYDSPVNVSINLGDPTWSDALAPGNSHGVNIVLMGAINTDGGESRMDNVGSVIVEGTYAETTNTDCLWRIGGSGDGNVRNLYMGTNFWKTARYAVKCLSGVQGFEVGPNYLSSIASAEVRLSTDIYGIKYRTGVAIGCFAQGPGPVAIAFRSLATSSVDFSAFTLEYDFLNFGVQSAPNAVQRYYPGGEHRTVQSTYRNIGSSGGVFFTTPVTAKPGTVASNVFTFTNLADCYAFNGGDRITMSTGGAQYVRSVDYAAGTALLDGGATPNGAATISQAPVDLLATTWTFSGAAPASGTWRQGSVCWNGVAAVGTPRGWLCTVTGTPGTWVSMGNL